MTYDRKESTFSILQVVGHKAVHEQNQLCSYLCLESNNITKGVFCFLKIAPEEEMSPEVMSCMTIFTIGIK